MSLPNVRLFRFPCTFTKPLWKWGVGTHMFAAQNKETGIYHDQAERNTLAMYSYVDNKSKQSNITPRGTEALEAFGGSTNLRLIRLVCVASKQPVVPHM